MKLRVVGVVPVIGRNAEVENRLASEGVLNEEHPVSSLIGEGRRDVVSAEGAEGLGGVFADEGAVAEGGHLCLKAG